MEEQVIPTASIPPTHEHGVTLLLSHLCRWAQGGCSTVAYQQASAVAKPPAAVLSSQHEGEGLTGTKNANTKITY